jgi:hypothetical protein
MKLPSRGFRPSMIACNTDCTHAMYVDKLDGRIDRSFYVQMSEQWQLERDKLM